MSEYRIKVAPNTVAYADVENHKLLVEDAVKVSIKAIGSNDKADGVLQQ
jgi:hypothetical protein